MSNDIPRASQNSNNPGVYLTDTPGFGNSVVPVATAVPAFIGYTDQTTFNGKDLINVATRITSLAEFLMIFGDHPPQVKFDLSSSKLPASDDPARKEQMSQADFWIDDATYQLANTTLNYRLYSSIKFFYQNGGGDCYVVSIGSYDYNQAAISDTSGFTKALDLLKKETEPTLVVIPDLVEIQDPTADPTSATYLQDKYADAYAVQNQMLAHCGALGSRMAILDIPGGYSEPANGPKTYEQFRISVEPTEVGARSYGAAYYPWLCTNVIQISDITFANLDTKAYAQVAALLTQEFTNAQGQIKPDIAKLIAAFKSSDAATLKQADATLRNISSTYQKLLGAIQERMNLLAPSAGIAGVYTSVDNSRGVWSAPANVAMQSTIKPTLPIDNDLQQVLNTPTDGKSICAIRAFPGQGNLVWGARTLDGNSLDFRYVNVRRTLMFIEQSIKLALTAYTFEPNDSSTWNAVKSMTESFLQNLWQQGALIGSTPSDSFSVAIGLGSTMSEDDILNGILRMNIKLALTRPAEFIALAIEHEMQAGVV